MAIQPLNELPRQEEIILKNGVFYARSILDIPIIDQTTLLAEATNGSQVNYDLVPFKHEAIKWASNSLMFVFSTKNNHISTVHVATRIDYFPLPAAPLVEHHPQLITIEMQRYDQFAVAHRYKPYVIEGYSCYRLDDKGTKGYMIDQEEVTGNFIDNNYLRNTFRQASEENLKKHPDYIPSHASLLPPNPPPFLKVTPEAGNYWILISSFTCEQQTASRTKLELIDSFLSLVVDNKPRVPKLPNIFDTGRICFGPRNGEIEGINIHPYKLQEQVLSTLMKAPMNNHLRNKLAERKALLFTEAGERIQHPGMDISLLRAHSTYEPLIHLFKDNKHQQL